MKKSHTSNYKFFIMLFLCFFVLAGQPVEFGQENIFFHGFLIEKPVIRVGLGVNLSDIKITSSSGMNIYEINSCYKLIAENVEEALIRGRKEKLTQKYIIQVAQSKDWEEAELIAQDLRTKIGQNVFVTTDEEQGIEGIFQVKVGDFLTRGDALEYIIKLNRIGIKEPWIIREEITEEESRPLWILVNDELKSLHDETLLYFIPSNPESFLSFNDRDYRGLFVLKATQKGIVLVNILNIEDYLKAVVPSELSPYDFHEMEAHKAQAVAARTYAFKKLGSNEELGFDLRDTPNSQFYKGMNAEHPFSSEAVEQTKGEVALYKGRLIDALYTSTCGGMTEDVEEVFMGPALPYLRATECVYEKQKEWILRSSHSPLPIYIGEKNIAMEIASLISLGVIPREFDPLYYHQAATFTDAVNWINNARTLLGKKESTFSPEPSSLNFTTLASLIIHGFEWVDRADNLLLESETDFILKNIGGTDGEDKDFTAYLIQTGIYPDFNQIVQLDRPLDKGELALYLWRVIQSYEGMIGQGEFKELDGERIILETPEGDEGFKLSPDFHLVRNFGGEVTFASQLYLLGGEQTRWIGGKDGIKLLEVIYPPHSNVLDRNSIYHSWQIRKSKQALEKRINLYYPIGELIDLVPQKRGKSRRIVELLIKGSKTQVVVKGLRIRRVLGLRETLFVIEKEYEESGQLTYFIFNGRGWGHGVGLCQVGAFGMARAGADYKSILKKYYQGIKISKIY
jgi:stage II sporulation protein D